MEIKYLLIHPIYGLCNQLIVIMNGIILAHQLKRNLCISGFLPNYNSPQTVPIEQMLDIPHLNNLIKKLKLNTEIITLFKKTQFSKLITISNADLETSLQSYSKFDYIKYLDAGITFDFTYKNKSLLNLRDSLYKNFLFEKKWYILAHKIKQNLGLINYSTIHLRLEDDMINSLATTMRMSPNQISDQIIKSYTKEIQSKFKPIDTIYICTGLIKYLNKNNYYLIELKKIYPNIKESSQLKLSDPNIKGRECYAILDYIIAYQSKFLLGITYSTFSLLLKHRTPNHLFNPFAKQ